MTYKEFLELLEELELDLDSAAEALDLEISDIEAWEEEDEIPKSAEKWIKKEKVEFATLHNTNEDENFEDEEDTLDETDENEEDLDLDLNEEEEK
jgi:hypothetical protein|tara:strand:- start:78 stop:362 length:285 start_codon:yes stop_codon:yes gene_type:complete